MSKATHTPTPWRIAEFNQRGTLIIADSDERGKSIIVCDCDHGVTRDPERIKISKSNAELILTAINHHQELVTRLHNLVNQFDDNFPEGGASWLALTEAKETLKKVIQ